MSDTKNRFGKSVLLWLGAILFFGAILFIVISNYLFKDLGEGGLAIFAIFLVAAGVGFIFLTLGLLARFSSKDGNTGRYFLIALIMSLLFYMILTHLDLFQDKAKECAGYMGRYIDGQCITQYMPGYKQ